MKNGIGILSIAIGVFLGIFVAQDIDIFGVLVSVLFVALGAFLIFSKRFESGLTKIILTEAPEFKGMPVDITDQSNVVVLTSKKFERFTTKVLIASLALMFLWVLVYLTGYPESLIAILDSISNNHSLRLPVLLIFISNLIFNKIGYGVLGLIGSKIFPDNLIVLPNSVYQLITFCARLFSTITFCFFILLATQLIFFEFLYFFVV